MSSLFLSNEELGKKDDDHRPTKIPAIRPRPWSAASARVPPPKTLKRVGIALALGILTYLFFANIPTDVPARNRFRPHYEPDYSGSNFLEPKPMPKMKPVPKPVPPSPPPPAKDETDKATSQEPGSSEQATTTTGRQYSGPLRFEKLGETLQSIWETQGSFAANRNVLFAASNLKSAAALLPMACQMGSELRNYVHFALMGGSEIDLDDLKAINGIDEDCQIIFHDARPNMAAVSTEARLGKSVLNAFYHISKYMHPQVVFVDGSAEEEQFLLEGARLQSSELHFPVIELPRNGPKKLGWASKLDSSSLTAWNKVNFDILIHASPGASGSLIRLLKSLSAADFTGSAVPHLTIELPHDLDVAATQFIDNFRWPPAHVNNPTHAQQLTLRRRIPRAHMNEHESSVRFLESFWPVDRHSHVLVLSPQAELSPQFFHYLKYSTLEYLYSSAAATHEWDSRLFGISLDLPSTQLTEDTHPLRHPTRGDVVKPALKVPRYGMGDDYDEEEEEEEPEVFIVGEKGTMKPAKGLNKNKNKKKQPPTSTAVDKDAPTSFLWQAPNSNAVLYNGRKWIELHDFVSRLFELEQQSPSQESSSTKKLVSKHYPAWLEHALTLSRARGYWTVYPGPDTEAAIVHRDLYRMPEEYEHDQEQNKGGKTKQAEESSLPARSPPALEQSLPAFDDMPLLLWDGRPTSLEALDTDAKEYTEEFRRTVVGDQKCNDLKPADLVPRSPSTADLFCVTK